MSDGYIGVTPVTRASLLLTQGIFAAPSQIINVAGGYSVGNIAVYINGLLLKTGDYVASDGSTINLLEVFPENTDYVVQEFRSFEVAEGDALPKTGGTLSGNVNNVAGGWLQVPQGTSLQAGSPDVGKIRYNTETNRYEGGYGGQYRSIGGGADGGGTDEVFFLNNNVITEDYTIASGRNAGTFGPIMIEDDVVVTIEDNATWVIV